MGNYKILISKKIISLIFIQFKICQVNKLDSYEYDGGEKGHVQFGRK
jgi:hypothetical protein